MKKVIFSSKAKRKLENLLEYLETEWSVKVKHAFIDKLDAALLRISHAPGSCPMSEKRKVFINA